MGAAHKSAAAGLATCLRGIGCADRAHGVCGGKLHAPRQSHKFRGIAHNTHEAYAPPSQQGGAALKSEALGLQTTPSDMCWLKL